MGSTDFTTHAPDVLGIFAANGMTVLAFGAAAVACLVVAMLPRVGGRRKVPVERDRRFERDGRVVAHEEATTRRRV
jgi:hypothetical protein